jgi:tryptophan synthase alpha chain
MHTQKLFDQIKSIRNEVSIPLIIMGYFNPIFQYGVEAFCKSCKDVGIDGLIIPDLPVDVYHKNYKSIFDSHELKNIFLITPQTSESRVRYIDEVSNGFIYMVSSASTTGAKSEFGDIQENYFKRINDLQLKNPQIVGFGISNYDTFKAATTYAKGAIIGSAFIKFLKTNGIQNINKFVETITSK